MLQDGEKGVIIQRDKKTYAVAPHIPCGVVQSEKYGAQALELIHRIIDFYKSSAKPHQRLGAMIEKMGFDEFKATILSE